MIKTSAASLAVSVPAAPMENPTEAAASDGLSLTPSPTMALITMVIFVSAMLADIAVNGRAVKAVAVPSKQGFLWVLDRTTGQPVWPYEERAVPQSDIPGEKTSPTQPFPPRPPAYTRNVLHLPDDLVDFTPDMRAQAVKQLSRYKVASTMYNPPILGDVNGLLGAEERDGELWLDVDACTAG